VKLTTHLRLQPRLRTRGATSPLPYVFMAWYSVKNKKILPLLYVRMLKYQITFENLINHQLLKRDGSPPE
jgi:hypothetical protein